MDDQQTYLLNGLLARQFGLGRIVRFRQVTRGRQADSFELFTAQERDYLVSLYPSTLPTEQLDFVARTVNTLDENRFTVVPFLKAKNGTFAAEGPQNSRMLVSLAPSGSALPPADYTQHDISQVGLRLAWMHRLLAEQLSQFPTPTSLSLAERFFDRYLNPESPIPEQLVSYDPASFRHLHSLLRMPLGQGWAHGDIQAAALLHDADHQLRVVTDWALLHYGSPLEDLVEAFLMLAIHPTGRLQPASGRALLEAYGSLVSVQRLAWTPVVAHWCARHLLDHAQYLRPLPSAFPTILPAPEGLATALASCT